MSDPILALEGVTVRLGGHESVAAVDLAIPEGSSSVIVGPSGCGKSTLLKVAAGLIPPDEGRVLLRGEDLATMGTRKLLSFRRVNGFVFQDAALWENKSIFENLALPLQVHLPELDRSEIGRRVSRALDRGNLAESAGLRPAQLSEGERKIASFLRATIAEPSIVFLDEPTLSVDAANGERIATMIRELRGRGCTILAVTHDPGLTTVVADRLIVLDEGRLAAAGPFDEVKRSGDPRVRAILARVLGEIAAFDTDLLALLDGDKS